MSYINSIGMANPYYKSEQMEIFEYMSSTLDFSEKERKVMRYLYKKSGIDFRYSVLADFGSENGKTDFFHLDNNFKPSIEKRLEEYNLNALPLALAAIHECMVNGAEIQYDFSHLICVSCTGMSAPGLDVRLINALNLSTDTQRYNINFMGCFAAVNGLRLAHTICQSDPKAKVLLVCVELCTLHFQNEISEDYNLSNMLFSDGAAAAIISNKKNTSPSYKIHSFHSDIISEGEQDMSWNISSNGFLMQLSGYVPQLLKVGMKELLDRVLSLYNLDINKLTYWAIHPGGKRILDALVNEFKLEEEKIRSSREVLREFGNMSSPTILFVLQRILETGNFDVGKYIFTAAFGPGLTAETAMLSYVE